MWNSFTFISVEGSRVFSGPEQNFNVNFSVFVIVLCFLKENDLAFKKYKLKYCVCNLFLVVQKKITCTNTYIDMAGMGGGAETIKQM